MSNNLVCHACNWKEHLDDASYCQSCGNDLNNYCTNPHCIANEPDDKDLRALPSNANFCPYCGSETTYYNHTCR